MVIGKSQYFSWDYSEKSDILNIHNAGKLTAGSAELGDFTIDFDKNGNIVGVEVMTASEFLSPMGILKQDLAKIADAKLIISKRANYFIVMVKLVLPEKIERIFTIPAPVVAEAAV